MKGLFCRGVPQGFSAVAGMKKGYITITNESLIFKSKKRLTISNLPISEIKEVIRATRRGNSIARIISMDNETYSYFPLTFFTLSTKNKVTEIISLLDKLKSEIKKEKTKKIAPIRRKPTENKMGWQILEKKINKPIDMNKLNKMMQVSSRLRLDMMRKSLEMDEKTFLDKIYDWAAEFGFTIDGDYLIINKNTVSDFIAALDQQFASWETKELDKTEKI